MILDTLERAEDYAALNPLFAEAFRRLRELRTRRDLPVGRLELDGDRLYAVVVRGNGRAPADAPLETHRRYIDIQYTLAGADRIGWRAARDCARGRGFVAEKDCELYDDAPSAWLDVPAGQFAIFFPADAHAPMANPGAPTEKIVLKVAV